MSYSSLKVMTGPNFSEFYIRYVFQNFYPFNSLSISRQIIFIYIDSVLRLRFLIPICKVLLRCLGQADMIDTSCD